MSLQDPIADFLTRIRNAQRAGKKFVHADFSKIKAGIAQVLKEEGYVKEIEIMDNDGKPVIVVHLKYHQTKPVIVKIDRISKPSCQIYVTKQDLPVVLGGMGVAIVSTSKGIMTASRAKEAGMGGEVLCTVY